MMSTMRAGVTGCYVHLPFCDRICPYCDFAVVAFERRRAARYLAALKTEIAHAPEPRLPVGTIFLGGGTPSALSAADLSAVLGLLFTKFGVAPGSIECSLEANPSRSIADIAAWRRAGVTRLSVGVQSLNDAELHRLGRDHTAAQAAAFVEAAQRQGIASVSIDLIAGTPGQSVDSFVQTLRRAVELKPDHVSVYGLTIEPGTPYAAWHAREPALFPDDDTVADMLTASHDTLAAAGFRHYEVSNFARPGHECRHNMGYWRQGDCIAFGMSASGYDDGLRYRNLRGFEEYCSAVETGQRPCTDFERLDFARRVGEAAMLALRTDTGVVYDEFCRRFDIDAASAFAEARNKCCAAGLLEADEKGVRLTARGRLLANEACAEFLTPRLEPPAAPPARQGVVGA